MLKKILSILFKDFSLFSLSYSTNIFPEPLSSLEEQKYIDSMLNGDKESRNILIEHNLRLVAHIVKKYDTNKDDIDDLISIGTIGLIKGIDSYKTNKGIKLTTYVARCIENAILTLWNAMLRLKLYLMY